MKYKMLFVFLCLITTLSAQTLTKERAESFIRTLIYDRPSLEKFFDPSDLSQSNRLRIQYEGVDWKILIGHDIDFKIREMIKSNQIGYSIKIRALEAPYSKLLFSTSDSTYKQAFFFKNDMMISPLTYFTRNMIQLKRGYVTFYTTDPSLLSNYSMNHVSMFIKDQSQAIAGFFDNKSQSEWLSYEDASWRHFYGIKYNPLIYIVCKDTHQIELITGFNTLGLSDLSMDAVISTSNSHYHELIHLIMNFNMSSIPLYTHPLLQEGIATYLGGRGGRSADVMLQSGEWLKEMNIIPLDSLLANQSFQQQDASISYSLSALICKEFIDHYGLKRFIQLYKRYSVNEEAIQSLTISKTDLNLDELFNDNGKSFQTIISCNDLSKGLFNLKANIRPVFSQKNLTIWNVVSQKTHNAYWKFEGFGTFLSKADDPEIYLTGSFKGYRSRLYKEKLPGKEYRFEHYLLLLTENEISLYDLYLDQLIAIYSNEFVQDSKKIILKNGKVTFYLSLKDAKFSFKPITE